MYWMAKVDVALTRFRLLLNCLKSIGMKDLEMMSFLSGVNYNSDYAAHEFLSCKTETI